MGRRMTADVWDGLIKLVTAIAALSGLILGVLANRKTVAEAGKIESERRKLEEEITERILLRSNEQFARMQGEIDELRAELQIYRLWSSMLCDQVRQTGNVPVPMPTGGRSAINTATENPPHTR